MAIDITALYCCLDDFCKVFEDWEAHRLIPSQTTRQRTGKLSRSEMLFIMVLFHLSPFKHFKVFYHYGIGQQHRACFRELPHYDRFVGLMPRLFAPLMVLLHSLSGAQTGIYFAAFNQACRLPQSPHPPSQGLRCADSDDVGRAFRLMSATCSDRSRPAVPTDVGRGGGAPAGRM